MARFRKRSRIEQGIPTGPMADISFLLIIFFMVTTVFVVYRGFPVDLPRAERIDPLKSRRNVVSIWIGGSGRMMVDEFTVTLDDVAEEAACGLLEQALAGKVAEGQIEPYFAQHTLDYDEAEVCWIHVSEEGVAEEIGMQVAEEGVRFHELARRYSEDEATRPAGGYLGRLRRDHLPKGVAPLVFAAKPGEMVGPLKVRRKHALYLVQEAFPATLTEAVGGEIGERLFRTWFKREMRRAQIAFPALESPIGGEMVDGFFF